jgi:transcriptional regulator
MDNLQGSIDLLVLRTLEAGPMHGYGIAVRIEHVSGDLLKVEEGSLYPALHRMEQKGWIAAEWGLSEKNRKARYYRLTDAGRAQLAAEREQWERVTAGVARVLQHA